MKLIAQAEQTLLDFESKHWPIYNQFPLNIKGENTVQRSLFHDIKSSTQYLIITGFTSLSYLIDVFGVENDEHLPHNVRILIGFEPNLKGRKNYELTGLNKEIKDYWLKNGLSIMQGGAVMRLIERINSTMVEFRYKNKMHAKLYVGDVHAILGSSNFSLNGLTKQDEANIRVSKLDPIETQQYEAIKLIAENFYDDAGEYSAIIDLLQQLISKVSWQEALARAIAEMVEGNWLEDYRNIITQLEKTALWPTQMSGLAQGISILQNQSNVLIADPTGAGKTKLCTALVLSLQHWLYEIGKHHHTESLIICPPLVVDKWGNEFSDFRKISHKQRSMGLLSNASGKNKKRVEQELQHAKILTIDEAHNYLSPDSNRTMVLRTNNADFKVLITATPISKKVEDLLRLIDLLDVDNLSDSDFEIFKLLNKHSHKAKEKNIEMLRSFISKFTVRRTKRHLNREIDKEPEKYCNRLGKQSRFPDQHEQVYSTGETDTDKQIAKQISELAAKLKGISYLIKFPLPYFETTNDDLLKQYVQKRINAARALTVYQIRAALRSSNVALIEHIEGTEAAQDLFGFKGKTKVSGNKLDILTKIKNRNKMPSRNKLLIAGYFPDWLNDKKLYVSACEEELRIYRAITNLAKQLSGARELSKVRTLINILKKHNHVLAFDTTVITLYYLKSLFEKNYPEQKIIVATGSDKENESRKLIQHFSLESESKSSLIGLCSDKMSESVDLQGASCVVLLDLPSVLRIVEQRIGRVDRMDSMHKSIDIYWPDDSEAFSLGGDRKLIHTNDLVEQIYGANFNVPAEIRGKHFSKTESVKTIIDEYKEFSQTDESWAVHDSFQCIHWLKEGASAIIDQKTYDEFRNVDAEVKTRVSFLAGEKSWCFVALRGSSTRSPKWYFLDDKDEIHSDYSDICNLLRQNISGNARNLEWDQFYLQRFINLLKKKERYILPPKKLRALEVALQILEKKVLNKVYSESETLVSYRDMIKILKAQSEAVIDFERLAEEWIFILKPYLTEKRAATRKKNILNLNSLKRDFKTIEISKALLEKITEASIITDEIDKRIAACIIGVSYANLMEVIL
ncbi:MAG: hypothetical protein EOO51_00115 [Flavobacterium sp.]|nr:MAG: hypothetical protein EOO51_00115 [Flavobacterium sp.]